MAVDQHPSRRPSPPRKPPATSTTSGDPNTVRYTDMGGTKYPYGSANGARMKLHVHDGKSEMSHHFLPAEGKAPKAGKEHPNEGTVSRASRPGDQ